MAVAGPRQSGETTLLKSSFPDYEYVSLENTDHQSFAKEDPIGFQKFNENKYQHFNYYFWQDHNGLEIDLMLKTANGFDLYEVKSTQTLNSTLFKNLQYFIKLVEPHSVRSYLIHVGDQALVRSNVEVLPWIIV